MNVSIPKKYARLYDREKAGEVVVAKVELDNVGDVYQDFADVNGDAGEWNEKDIRYFLEDFEDGKETFCDWLKIEIDQSEERGFWIALRRLMIMDIISWEFCDHEEPKKISTRELASMSEDEFRKKATSLSLIEFTVGTTPSPEKRKEFLDGIEEDGMVEDLEAVVSLGW